MADAFEKNAKTCLTNLRKDRKLAAKIDVPDDRIFVGFDAYQKAIAAGADIIMLATPPGFRPIHYAAAMPPASTFSWRSLCVSTPPASAPSWRRTSWPTRRA